MATRRRSSAAPTLVEGRTYNIPQPRAELRLARNITLRGPAMQAECIVRGGVLVPLAPAQPSVRQPLDRGSIVSLQNTRNHHVRDTSLLSEAIRYSVTNLTVGRYHSSDLFVVLERHDRYMSVAPLWRSSSYAVQLRADSGGVRLSSYNDDGVSASDVMRYSRNSVVTAQRHDIRLARANHVQRVFSPDELPASLTATLRSLANQQATRAMFDRLAQFEDERRSQQIGHPLPVRDSLWYRAGEMRMRARNRARIAMLFNSLARSWVANREQAFIVATTLHAALLEQLRHSYRSDSTRANARANEILTVWAQRHGSPGLRIAQACGHFHEGESEVTLLNSRYGDTGEFCPRCAANAVEVEFNGEMRLAQARLTYEWSDGVRRMSPEPGVIGNRHSGKGIVGFVEPITPKARDSYLTLGLELEMQAYNNNDREQMARAMRNQLKAANLLDDRALRKYLHFEEDGSTGPGGFEMVTGYTDLSTHSTLLHCLLCRVDGRPAWSGKLRSHDATGQSCGIHVHIQRPKSLVHASKMRYFINSAAMRRMISDVARRYNTSYARIDSAAGITEPKKFAAQSLKSCKGYHSKAQPTHQQMAIQRINPDRYQALNFQNTHTVEFRIFRGSMMHETVMACMEFTQAVWEFTRYTPATSLTEAAFVAFINEQDNRHATRHLRSFLRKKGWTNVVVPRERKPGMGKDEGPTTLPPLFVPQTTTHAAPLLVPGANVPIPGASHWTDGPHQPARPLPDGVVAVSLDELIFGNN